MWENEIRNRNFSLNFLTVFFVNKCVIYNVHQAFYYWIIKIWNYIDTLGCCIHNYSVNINTTASLIFKLTSFFYFLFPWWKFSWKVSSRNNRNSFVTQMNVTLEIPNCKMNFLWNCVDVTSTLATIDELFYLNLYFLFKHLTWCVLCLLTKFVVKSLFVSLIWTR